MLDRAAMALVAMLALGCASGVPLRVTLPDGDYLGRTYERTDVLLGVPYAEPPLGERRFAPPTAATSFARCRSTPT